MNFAINENGNFWCILYTRLMQKIGKNWKMKYQKVGTKFATLYMQTATAFIIFLCILKKVLAMVYVF